MADLRFHRRQGPFALGYLAEFVNGALTAPTDAEVMIADIADAFSPQPGCLVFCEDRRRIDSVRGSVAAAVLVRPQDADALTGQPVIAVASPAFAFAEIADLFYPPSPATGIDPGALVADTAIIGRDVEVARGAQIGPYAEIGNGTRIDANAVIGRGCILGAGCLIGANATLECAILGARVHVKPGARLGQSGFGFTPGPRGLRRTPQLGRVIIGDDVEVGANSCIDRGALNDTVIGAGSKIDNLVQIGHNTVVGKHCVIVAQVGIAGSAKLGDGVMLGGQSAIAGHLSIGSGAKVSAQAGVMRDLDPGAVVGGAPAVPIRQFHKQSAWLARQVMRKE